MIKYILTKHKDVENVRSLIDCTPGKKKENTRKKINKSCISHERISVSARINVAERTFQYCKICNGSYTKE